MEIRNLATFAEVAELNSFTRAAESLGYSQSTVSFQIKQLEEELGASLFDRINNKISLTDTGRELLEYAHKIGRLTEEFNDTLRSPREPDAHIHILAPNSVCEDMMTNNYMDFYASYPKITLKFTSVDTYDMFAMLDRNEADVMLTLDSHIFRGDYVIAKEEPVRMCFVTGRGSPYDKGEDVTLEALAEYPFVLTEKSTGYRRPFDNLLAERSLEIIPVLEMERTDIIADVLEGGVGVSFLPDFVVKSRIESGKLSEIPVKDVEITVWKQLIYHKKKWLSKSLLAFLEYVKAHEFRS